MRHVLNSLQRCNHSNFNNVKFEIQLHPASTSPTLMSPVHHAFALKGGCAGLQHLMEHSSCSCSSESSQVDGFAGQPVERKKMQKDAKGNRVADQIRMHIWHQLAIGDMFFHVIKSHDHHCNVVQVLPYQEQLSRWHESHKFHRVSQMSNVQKTGGYQKKSAVHSLEFFLSFPSRRLETIGRFHQPLTQANCLQSCEGTTGAFTWENRWKFYTFPLGKSFPNLAQI